MLKSPKQILQTYWGFDDFKGSQNEIIEALLSGGDVLALMPTGGGKSVCFQVPALVKEGICLVVSPLVALMQDQVQVLKQKGIKAIGLTGGIARQEVENLLDNCIYGNYKFLYLSPERLQQPLIKERILQMPVNLIAIDEAHCISEWGHDFRPTYRQCSIIRELHPDIPMIALTATATEKVANDILQNLKMENVTVYKDSFKRDNIAFIVQHRADKNYAVHQLFKRDTKSGIVYVRSRKDAVLLSNTLKSNGESADFFHGGLTSFEKREKLNAWLNDHIRIMVATNAFGMGVDKPDVGTVVHYQLPDSIENYYQEAGRAGRDRSLARAILLVNENDMERAKNQFLASQPDVSFTKKVFKKLNTFFQIAYNEGQNEEFHLNLNEFCGHYDLNPSKTYTTLKLLDQNGIISVLETSKELSTLHLVTKKEELFDWIDKYKKMGQIIQVLLRTYGGIFEFETKINLTLLSKKTNENQKFIDRTFVQLEKDGLAIYKNAQQDLKIVFLKPREDDNTINPIAPHIKKLNKTKHAKLNAMLSYTKDNHNCRTRLLLEYFGEKGIKPCGKCDVCMAVKKGPYPNLELKSAIVGLITSGDKTSRQLIDLINFDEKYVLVALKELLEDGKLDLKANNTYGIK